MIVVNEVHLHMDAVSEELKSWEIHAFKSTCHLRESVCGGAIGYSCKCNITIYMAMWGPWMRIDLDRVILLRAPKA